MTGVTTVGRTPWSARDALVPLSSRSIVSLVLAAGRPGGRPRTRGAAPPNMRPPSPRGTMRLDGKVVLITGASEGIGAACAAEFAAAGARLSLTARSADGLARAGGASALITAGDLTLEETRRRAIERT